MSVIDVSDIDVCVLIQALWSNMKPASFFLMSGLPSPPAPSLEHIKEHLRDCRYYVDYINGRCIKTDFSDLKNVDTRLYNRDAGNGAFERIVAQLRA